MKKIWQRMVGTQDTLKSALTVLEGCDRALVAPITLPNKPLSVVGWMGLALRATLDYLSAARAWDLEPVTERFPTAAERRKYGDDVICVRYYRLTKGD